ARVPGVPWAPGARTGETAASGGRGAGGTRGASAFGYGETGACTWRARRPPRCAAGDGVCVDRARDRFGRRRLRRVSRGARRRRLVREVPRAELRAAGA